MKKGTLPTVALIGRMNVGKSTLFNRLTESRRAITSSWAGTTRDVKGAQVIWRGLEFNIMDTGGLDVEDDEQLEKKVIGAARRAIDEADMILFVIDGKVGVLPQEKELAQMVRDSGKPVFGVVNKIDSMKAKDSIDPALYQFNFHTIYTVSAKNGRGSGDLLDGIFELLGGMMKGADVKDTRTKVAIVGRPNVGKSSLLNSILGEERVIVADKAHTTRDTNDIAYEYNGKPFVLIDTAGIRRKANVGMRWDDKRLGDIEKESVRAAIHAMERADVALLVIEAQERVAAQDKKIAELADQYGKGLIVVVNKWDLIPEKDSNTITEFSGYFDAALPFLRWAPMIFVSAVEHVRVRDILDVVLRVSENYERRVPQQILDDVLAKVRGGYKPKYTNVRKLRTKAVTLSGLTQSGIQPPRFILHSNKPKDIPKAIPRIIERELRDRVDFEGVKIIIEMP